MSNSGSSPSEPSGAVVLDAEAIARLRELDPTGGAKLLERVVGAFESSAAKLLGQLREAQAGGDAGTIRHVAHTLKSSSASIGALALSQHCAQIEAAVREGREADAAPHVEAVLSGVEPVLQALRLLVGRPA